MPPQTISLLVFDKGLDSCWGRGAHLDLSPFAFRRGWNPRDKKRHKLTQHQCKPGKLHNGHYEVHCTGCDILLGFQDKTAQGWRLYKWSLAVIPSHAAGTEIFALESILCTQLLALIDAQAVRKFVVHNGGTEDEATGILASPIWLPVSLC